MKTLFIFCMTITFSTHADIFKCQSDSGITAFQTSPCKNSDTQNIIKSKRRYRSVTDASVLSEEDWVIMFDDVMIGDDYASKLYIKYLKEHGEELFREEVYVAPKPPSEVTVKLRELQESIDRQNDLLQEQVDRNRLEMTKDQQQRIDNEEQFRKQQKLIRDQTRILREQEESIRENNRLLEEAKRQKSWEEFDQNKKDIQLQQRLDDLEYEIRNPY